MTQFTLACTALVAVFDGTNWRTIGASNPGSIGPNGFTPGIAYSGTAAGSLVAGSNDAAGAVNLTNLGSGSGATVFTITFTGTYGTPMFCGVTPSGVAGANLYVNSTPSLTGFTVMESSTGGAATVTVVYQCKQ